MSCLSVGNGPGRNLEDAMKATNLTTAADLAVDFGSFSATTVEVTILTEAGRAAMAAVGFDVGGAISVTIRKSGWQRLGDMLDAQGVVLA